MRTLLIGSDLTAPGSPVAEALDAAGHDVVRCHAADAPAFPSAGLTDDGCPIEGHGPIDVAITVRPDGAGAPTAEESGATCAIRAGLPVVVVGGEAHPFAAWSESVPSADDLVADLDGTVARATAGVAERRAAPIVEEVRRLIAVEGVDAGEVSVDVVRDGDTAHITIRTDREVPEHLANAMATRAHAVDTKGSWPTSKTAVSVGTH